MLCDGKPLNVGAFASRHLRLGAYETRAIAFSKMKGNLIKSALFPLFCLCQPKRVEPPNSVAMWPIANPKDKLFEREEIRQRMADFKATQSKFEREREEYFKKTMAKVRSNSSGNAA
jgi:hypothetical protein